MTNLVHASGKNIDWAYNAAGDVVAMVDPYLGLWTYARDFAGRLRWQTDARGDVVSNSYVNPATGQQDVLGRLQVQTDRRQLMFSGPLILLIFTEILSSIQRPDE